MKLRKGMTGNLCQGVVVALVLAGSVACSRGPAIRINSGGPEFTDRDGNKWQADREFVGGVTFVTEHPVKNTETSPLYQNHRYGNSFRYVIPVGNGRASVKLKFAEIYFEQPGKRVFNVSINNHPVLQKFDVVAAAGGPFTALDKEFPVDVTDGRVTIVFTPIADNPMVAAIEVDSGG